MREALTSYVHETPAAPRASVVRQCDRLRVLLLDEGFMSGVVIARGLARAGCIVDVIAATGGHGSSQRDGGRWQLAPRFPDPRLMRVINDAVVASDYDVVYPVTEPLQRLLWTNAPTWQSRIFPFVDATQRLLRHDKRAMSAMIASAGICVPQEMPAATDAEVTAAVRELGLPIVIKGATGRGGTATRICASLEFARAAMRWLDACDVASFAQQYVPGLTYLAGGVFERGVPRRFFSGVKRLQFPARVGPAAEMESVVDEQLTTTAMRIFAAAQVTGLASIDLMRDTDGQFLFLELNHRPWGSMRAAEDSGVELFDELVRLWRQEPATPQLPLRARVRTPIFPLCLLSWPFLRHDARAVLPDVRHACAVAARDPRFALHVLHRVTRMAINW